MTIWGGASSWYMWVYGWVCLGPKSLWLSVARGTGSGLSAVTRDQGAEGDTAAAWGHSSGLTCVSRHSHARAHMCLSAWAHM